MAHVRSEDIRHPGVREEELSHVARDQLCRNAQAPSQSSREISTPTPSSRISRHSAGAALSNKYRLVFFRRSAGMPPRTAIKFLVDDGRLDYIESGSLLGVSHQNVPSRPKDTSARTCIPHHRRVLLRLRESMKRHEPLRALRSGQPIPNAIHERLTRLFPDLPTAVGGMPSGPAIRRDSRPAQVLLTSGRFSTHNRQDIEVRQRHMYERYSTCGLPSELDAKNKRSKLSDLSKSARSERYASDFMWFTDSGVALP